MRVRAMLEKFDLTRSKTSSRAIS